MTVNFELRFVIYIVVGILKMDQLRRVTWIDVICRWIGKDLAVGIMSPLAQIFFIGEITVHRKEQTTPISQWILKVEKTQLPLIPPFFNVNGQRKDHKVRVEHERKRENFF